VDKTDGPSELIPKLLARIMQRHGVDQAFLFSGGGEHFYAGRHPVLEAELALLQAAFDLLETLDRTKVKPFVAHDPKRRFSVAAMSETSDFYLVCLNLGPDPDAAKQRILAFKDDVLPDLPAVGGRARLRLL